MIKGVYQGRKLMIKWSIPRKKTYDKVEYTQEENLE